LFARYAKRRLIICAFLFVAVLLRYWISYDPDAFVPRHPETFRIAHNLYERGQFANPFISSETGPSAHLAPAFPNLLAGLMMIFGDKSFGLYAIQLVALLVLALQLSLYPLFSRALGMGSLTGVIGACAWILAKPALVYGWEAFYASLALAGACCFYRRQLDLQEPAGSTWALGSIMGLSTLLVPTALPVFGAWLAWDIWKRRAVFFKRFVLPLAVLPSLIVIPWTIRNYSVFHRFIPVRDDLGLELSVSNNYCAQFAMEMNFHGCFQYVHPNRSEKEARKVIDLGEADYNRLRFREALDWIKTHPRRFTWLSTCRFIAWWLPTDSGTLHYAEYPGRGRLLERYVTYSMTLLSIGGLIILYERDVKSAAVCASLLAIFPFIYYFIQYQDRYRYPVMWVTFLLGALPISIFARRLCSGYR
jgi:hypothetical protein